MPANPMTPKGGSQMMHGNPQDDAMPMMDESKETFRRRTTPATGQPDPGQTALQQILALLNGGR